MEALQGKYEVSESCLNDARSLDKFYIPTRYPNGFDAGAPADYYTHQDAEAAYEAAQRIMAFCESQISGS
jgi:HEPN domain-containing protein